MKAEILLQMMIAQGGIQAVDAKTQTGSEVFYDIKTLLNISL